MNKTVAILIVLIVFFGGRYLIQKQHEQDRQQSMRGALLDTMNPNSPFYRDNK
ncbi:hypothetical protein [Halarcobacter ebronensis]|uniref:hypothetical protein n=1 Tax=Halarcobacter ebronensis TaxID=1462615 RepID=UPI0013E90BDB|nr:hypothetical protein [Halarcobacter ebronensis]QKF81474.1 hypothetical protein AEBR_0975 [Halarcobacter ebronensis]